MDQMKDDSLFYKKSKAANNDIYKGRKKSVHELIKIGNTKSIDIYHIVV